ncbi:RidA family protein [Tropicibacter sp. R16_0]|uniref:RidA family protein n=1 Tax=Tropicibacter sp. R16_0 TaxID=2821102 RepID=UPI001ADB55B2|nr:RidA family protein [Tropicibacter sp. R16_0]MBO9451166.1 RidA family protein [Tropicibacter sp. R16_0]
MKALDASDARPPFGRYSHGIEIPAGWRVVKTSGQLGIRSDDSIPDGAYEQAVICFETIRQILSSGGMGPEDVAHVAAYVTDRAHFPDYMRARDEFIGERHILPTSTLLIVSGFTRPEFKVEVEVMAAKP